MDPSAELGARFKLRGPLRCDGVGKLHCADDARTGARLAIHWLPISESTLAAVRAVDALPRHPMLPAIVASGRTESAAYWVMDYPEGVLLSELLEEPFAAPELAGLGRDLAEVLAVLHRQGVVHGRLCPDSVRVAGRRRLLWDLPLALALRLTDRRGGPRALEQLATSATYLAPERAAGGPPSPEADVYALGVILCRAAGSDWTKVSSTLHMLHRVSRGQWRPSPPASLPAELRAVIERLLAPEPSRRPSAGEVSQLLAPHAPAQSDVPTDPAAPVFEPEGAETLLDAEVLLSALTPPTRPAAAPRAPAPPPPTPRARTVELAVPGSGAPAIALGVPRAPRPSIPPPPPEERFESDWPPTDLDPFEAVVTRASEELSAPQRPAETVRLRPPRK